MRSRKSRQTTQPRSGSRRDPDYCRATRTAESTSGGVVNVASWCRACATAQDNHRHSRQGPCYLSQYRGAPPSAPSRRRRAQRSTAPPPRPTQGPPASGFSTTGRNISCSSRPAGETEIANRISLELGNLQPSAGASDFDAVSATDVCAGDGGCSPFPTCALRVAKEITNEDVGDARQDGGCLLNIQHRARHHNSIMRGAWLTPARRRQRKADLEGCGLSGNTATALPTDRELKGFCGLGAGISPVTATGYTGDHLHCGGGSCFLLDPIMRGRDA